MSQQTEHILSYFLHGSIFCLGIYIPVSKPSICFWKRVISAKWRNKLLIYNIVFKSIIYPSFDRVLKHGMVNLKMFRKLSLNFNFGQSSYLISDFALPNSMKAVLLQISLKFGMVIFNSNFSFCLAGFLKPLMISFCSMAWVAGWLPPKRNN